MLKAQQKKVQKRSEKFRQQVQKSSEKFGNTQKSSENNSKTNEKHNMSNIDVTVLWSQKHTTTYKHIVLFTVTKQVQPVRVGWNATHWWLKCHTCGCNATLIHTLVPEMTQLEKWSSDSQFWSVCFVDTVWPLIRVLFAHSVWLESEPNACGKSWRSCHVQKCCAKSWLNTRRHQ